MVALGAPTSLTPVLRRLTRGIGLAAVTRMRESVRERPIRLADLGVGNPWLGESSGARFVDGPGARARRWFQGKVVMSGNHLLATAKRSQRKLAVCVSLFGSAVAGQQQQQQVASRESLLGVGGSSSLRAAGPWSSGAEGTVEAPGRV